MPLPAWRSWELPCKEKMQLAHAETAKAITLILPYFGVSQVSKHRTRITLRDFLSIDTFLRLGNASKLALLSLLRKGVKSTAKIRTFCDVAKLFFCRMAELSYLCSRKRHSRHDQEANDTTLWREEGAHRVGRRAREMVLFHRRHSGGADRQHRPHGLLA